LRVSRVLSLVAERVDRIGKCRPAGGQVAGDEAGEDRRDETTTGGTISWTPTSRRWRPSRAITAAKAGLSGRRRASRSEAGA
jgi:hypothetical protein